MNILFDMETRDPDDVFALCWLAGHPGVDLLAVTINPGSREQVGLVRSILERLGRRDVPVGSRNADTNASAVSGFHHAFLGIPASSEPDALAHDLLAQALTAVPDAVVLTGAPLHNLRNLLTHHPEVTIQRWVGQGGFAGDSVVSPQHRLPKFSGLETCVTRNLSGEPKAAAMMLASPQVQRRELVSKNVCHGVIYDTAMHERLRPFRDATLGLRLIHEGMTLYLHEQPEGKMFHDPLATCIAVDPEIAVFEEVELYHVQGEWGCKRASGTGTFITVAIDRERFLRTLASK